MKYAVHCVDSMGTLTLPRGNGSVWSCGMGKARTTELWEASSTSAVLTTTGCLSDPPKSRCGRREGGREGGRGRTVLSVGVCNVKQEGEREAEKRDRQTEREREREREREEKREREREKRERETMERYTPLLLRWLQMPALLTSLPTRLPHPTRSPSVSAPECG